MRINIYTIVAIILGVVLLPTTLSADVILAEESDNVILGSETTPESELILSLPFSIDSSWASAPADTPGITWVSHNQPIKFAVKDGKFISTNFNDTWFVYGWFGPIEAINKAYNVKYTKWGNRHNGIDFAGKMGLDIISASDGEVIFTGTQIGNTVVVKKDNYLITYGHLQDILIETGDTVKTGDLIGHLGNSSTVNPHLHFEVDQIENNYKIAINPLTLFEDIDWDNMIIPDADANLFYNGSANPELQPNFIW